MFTFFGVTYLLTRIARVCLMSRDNNDEPRVARRTRSGPRFSKSADQFVQHRSMLPTRADSAEVGVDGGTSGGQAEDPELPWLRINWEIKALVPIACVLLGGMLLFLLATLSWRDPERHMCFSLPERARSPSAPSCWSFSLTPCSARWSNCSRRSLSWAEAISSVSVSFAHRNDEIGDLGRNFNQMVPQLRESRDEIERLHRTQMSRAEHLATLAKWRPDWRTKSAIPWPGSPA